MSKSETINQQKSQIGNPNMECGALSAALVFVFFFITIPDSTSLTRAFSNVLKTKAADKAPHSKVGEPIRTGNVEIRNNKPTKVPNRKSEYGVRRFIRRFGFCLLFHHYTGFNKPNACLLQRLKNK